MRITLGQSQACVAIHHLLCVSDAVFRLSGVPDSASDQQDDPAVVWWWTSCVDRSEERRVGKECRYRVSQ